MKYSTLLILLSFIATLNTFGQTDSATAVVITNMDGAVLIDGIEKGNIHSASAFRLKTTSGEHYIEIKADNNGTIINKGKIIQFESGDQKIVKIDFDLDNQQDNIEIVPIADMNFNLPGTIATIAWESDNPDQIYPYPEYYYAFEKGDKIILDVNMSNKNGTNVINISTYPDGKTIYSNNAFSELNNLTIDVPVRSIYKLTFATNHAFDRNCFVKVKRIPASKETIDFNTTVKLTSIFEPVVIHEPQKFYINSGSNATFKGGKSRVTLPIQLPPNTIEWFYRFSAFREESDIENVQQNISLFTELSNLISNLSGSGAIASGLSVDMLSQPPGADICDIYLLTDESRRQFEVKTEDWSYYPDASRLNFASGNAKVTCCTEGRYYLGIKNTDDFYGINVSVEVVAITAKEDYVMANGE